MRHVPPTVDGFEVAPGELHRAAGRTSDAAHELGSGVAALRGLALGPSDVGPGGADLAAAVARFAGRSADRLEATARGLAADATATRAAAEAYAGADHRFATELEQLT